MKVPFHVWSHASRIAGLLQTVSLNISALAGHDLRGLRSLFSPLFRANYSSSCALIIPLPIPIFVFQWHDYLKLSSPSHFVARASTKASDVLPSLSLVWILHVPASSLLPGHVGALCFGEDDSAPSTWLQLPSRSRTAGPGYTL